MNRGDDFVLLSIPISARRDFVGQDGILRRIVNPPARGNEAAALFAACRYVGLVANLRPIVNRPAVSILRACRFVGQPILAAAGFQPASSGRGCPIPQEQTSMPGSASNPGGSL